MDTLYTYTVTQAHYRDWTQKAQNSTAMKLPIGRNSPEQFTNKFTKVEITSTFKTNDSFKLCWNAF